MIKKYNIENVRLFWADGAKFELKNENINFINKKLYKKLNNGDNILNNFNNSGLLIYYSKDDSVIKKKFIENNKNFKKDKEKSKENNIDNEEVELYDKILLDAECTSNGNLKHLKKINLTSKR
jgi:hypothetical protein